MKIVINFVTKKRHVMIGMIITILLMILGSTTASASINEERLDGLLSDNIVGWVWNSSTPNTPATVKVIIKKYSTSKIVQDTILSTREYRDDLKASDRGIGKYGFTASITWDITGISLYLMEYTVNGETVTNSLCCQGGEIASAVNGGLIPLGTFRTIACCSCRFYSSGWGGWTNTGTIAITSRTISVDPSVTPYGSHVMINGIIYTAEDIGSGVNGKHIDIFFNTHAECRSHGARNMEAFLVV